MAVSNLHQGVVAGAAANQGTVFDTTLIPNSVWMDGSGTSGDAMTRTSRTPGNRNRWLFGTWYQPLRVPLSSSDRITIFAASDTGTDSNTSGFYLSHEEEGDIRLFHRDEDGNEGAVVTTEFYRDATSWIHILVDYDSANANSADRLTMYVNGEKVGVNSGTRPAQNKSIMVNTEGVIERIGHDFSTTPDNHGSMYLAQTFLMDNKSIVNGDHATTDFLDTFAFGTHGSQIIPKSNDDIKTLVAAAGVNSFFLNYEDVTDKGSVDGMTRDRKATESTNHVLGITPTVTESLQSGAADRITNGQRANGIETTGTTLTLLFDLGSGNEQAVQSVSFTTEGITSFKLDPGQGGGSQSNGRIKDLTISGSNNGTDFTTLSSSTVAQKRSNALHVVSWSNTTAYRYLKFANANIHGGLRSNVGGMGFHTEQSPVIGNDFWGDKNHSTSSGASEINQDHQSGNTPSNLYPIINIIDHSNHTLPTISEGNLRSAGPGSSRACLRTTIAIPTTGKWYWEAKWNSVASARIGFAESNSELLSNCGQSALSWGIQNDGTLVNNNSSGSALFSWSTNDIIAMAYDADASKFWFGRIPSGSTSVTWASSGNPETGANATVTSVPTQITPAIDTNTGDVSLFFPEEDWTLSSKLSGFKEINSANLTAPDFQGIDYFDSTIYEGNGQSQRVGDFVPFTDTYAVAKSAMFTNGDVRYLARTYSVSDSARDSNSQATLSFWIKFCSSGTTNHIFSSADSTERNRFLLYINDQAGQQSIYMTLEKPGGGLSFQIPIGNLSEQEWTNFVYNVDVDNGTGADKIKCWVNGVQQTSTDSGYQSLDNTRYKLFENEAHFIGNLPPVGGDFSGTNGYSGFAFNSYLAEMHVLDGLLKAPSDFGQVDTSTNRWVPKDYKTNVGSYGARGFYMAFDNAAGTGNGVGTDSSGNGFHFANTSHATSGSAWATTDTVTDTPSNNKAILEKSTSVATISEGGLKIAATGNAYQWGTSSLAIPSSGKWVFEAQSSNIDGSSLYGYIGIAQRGGVAGSTNTGNNYLYALNLGNGEVVRNSSVVVDLGAGATTSVMRIEYDAGIDQIKIYDDNSLVHTATTHLSGHASLHFVVAPYGSGADFTVKFTDFTHTPTTDFKALTQDNLDATASKLTAWAWIKNRDATDSHMLVDRVRGVGVEVHTDGTTTTPETTNDNTVRRFLQRGVQIGSDVQVNTASESYVLWQWLVGSSATTGSTTSPAGTIASTSIVADAGHFSVVSWTGNETLGATVGHGLGGEPEFIIAIARAESGENKPVYHKFMTSDNDHLKINEANAQGTAGSTIWDVSAMSSTVIGLGAAVQSNSNNGMIAYCFRSVPGVCKIGSYEGSGSADGPYIHTGFKPRWIIIKNIDVARDWTIADTARHPYNVVGEFLYASSSAVESARGVTSGTDYDLDILSDGFKIRTVDGALNSSTLIYMAMAEIGGNGTLPPIYGR